MDHAAQLAHVEACLADIDRLQELITRARGQTVDFRPAVIEKVVGDLELERRQALDALLDRRKDIADAAEGLRQRRENGADRAEHARFRLAELDLLLAIGQTPQDGDRTERARLEEVLEGVDERTAILDDQIRVLGEALDRSEPMAQKLERATPSPVARRRMTPLGRPLRQRKPPRAAAAEPAAIAPPNPREPDAPPT